MNNRHRVILLTLVSLLSSCNLNSSKYNSLKPIDAPEIISILNNNYSKTLLMQDKKNGYTYLKLPENHNSQQQLEQLLQKYVKPEYKKCYKFNDNSHGLHVTVLEHEATKDSPKFKNLVGKEYNIKYDKLKLYLKYVNHSHNKRLVYWVQVTLKPEDLSQLTNLSPYVFSGEEPHVSLSDIFEMDQDNECVRHNNPYKHIASQSTQSSPMNIKVDN